MQKLQKPFCWLFVIKKAPLRLNVELSLGCVIFTRNFISLFLLQVIFFVVAIEFVGISIVLIVSTVNIIGENILYILFREKCIPLHEMKWSEFFISLSVQSY